MSCALGGYHPSLWCSKPRNSRNRMLPRVRGVVRTPSQDEHLSVPIPPGFFIHTHPIIGKERRPCPSDRMGACSCSCSEILISEVCTGFLSSWQLPSSVGASWWQNLYGFQSHSKQKVTFSISHWLSHILDPGISLNHCKERNHCVSFFCSVFLFKKNFFFENFIHRYHIHIISIPCLSHALLSCPQIHYFLLLKLLLLDMYTYTHMHTYLYTHPLESTYYCLYVQVFRDDHLGSPGSLSLRKLIIPFLAAIYCLQVFIQGPCEIPLNPCWYVWFCLAIIFLRSHGCSIPVVSIRF